MDLDRTYERFRGGPFVGYGVRYHVTINHNGKIHINANLYNRWGKPTGVYLHYSREHDKIALVPTTPSGSEAFPIRPGRSGIMIYTSNFCRHFGIHFDGTRKFINPEVQDDGKLILDLRNTVLVTKPWSRKK